MYYGARYGGCYQNETIETVYLHTNLDTAAQTASASWERAASDDVVFFVSNTASGNFKGLGTSLEDGLWGSLMVT